MARGDVDIEGFRELDATFVELGKSTGRNTLRRVAKRMLEPMRARAAAGARKRSGALSRDVKIGTRLAPSQRKGAVAVDSSKGVVMHMGPGQLPQAITEEFGTFAEAGHPFMRPAFDAEAQPAIETAGDLLWNEVEAAVARKARKAARGARR